MAVYNIYNNGTPTGLTYKVLQQNQQPTTENEKKNLLWVKTGADSNVTVEEDFVSLEPNYSFDVNLDNITNSEEKYYIIPETKQNNTVIFNKSIITNKNIYYRHRVKLRDNNNELLSHYFCISVNLNEVDNFAFGYNNYEDDPNEMSLQDRKTKADKLYYYYPKANGSTNNLGYTGGSGSSTTPSNPLHVTYYPESSPNWLYIYINLKEDTLCPSKMYADLILSYTLKNAGTFPVSIERIDKDNNEVLSTTIPKNNYGLIKISQMIDTTKSDSEILANADNFRDTGLNPSPLGVYSFSLQKGNTYKISLPDAIIQRAISEINGEIKLDLSHLSNEVYTPENNERIIFSITSEDLENNVFPNLYFSSEEDTIDEKIKVFEQWIKGKIRNYTLNYKIVDYYKTQVENTNNNNKIDYYISPTDPRLHTPNFMQKNENEKYIGGPLWIKTSDSYTNKTFDALQSSKGVTRTITLHPEAVLKYLDLTEFKRLYDKENQIPFVGVWMYLPAQLYIAELDKWFKLNNKISTGITAIAVNGELLTDYHGIVNITIPKVGGGNTASSSYSVAPIADTPFYKYNLSFNTTQSSWKKDADGSIIVQSNLNGTDYIPCPKYLGFQCIKPISSEASKSEAPYIYIGTLNKTTGQFALDTKYIFNTFGSTNIINRLTHKNNHFVEIDNYKDKVFYAICPESTKDYFEVIGSDIFYENTDVCAITPATVKTENDPFIDYEDNKEELEPNESHNITYVARKKNSVLLPSNCYYVILNKLNGNKENYNEENSMILSYDNGEDNTSLINYPPSFGYAPNNVGAILLQVPDDPENEDNNIFKDIAIYTNTKVESSSNSGQRRKAKKFAKDIIEKFQFTVPSNDYEFELCFENESGEITIDDNSTTDKDGLKVWTKAPELQYPKYNTQFSWDGQNRRYGIRKNYHGIPYSSHWENAHFVGFEISPKTAANALKDPYSIMYDGAVYTRPRELTIEKNGTEFPAQGYVRRKIYNTYGRTECNKDGGPGYGLVCGAFALLIHGNAYPQTNRGFTFDSNFIIEHTDSISAGDILVNKKFSHVVTVDETYNNGYSLIEARGPCTMKTVHTNNLLDNNLALSYLNRESNIQTLDSYPYKIQILEKANQDNAIQWFNDWFDDPSTTSSPIRPWRGNQSVYGPWDTLDFIKPNGPTPNYVHGGIGATITKPGTYYLYSGNTPVTGPINITDESHYIDFTSAIKTYINEENLNSNTPECFNFNFRTKEDTSRQSYFRYYYHKPVYLKFDINGEVSFTYDPEGEEPADDIEYAYIEVFGYGGIYEKLAKEDGAELEGPIVVAKGKRYPDLLKPGIIRNVYAAIASDTSTKTETNEETQETITVSDSWGKYSCRFAGYKPENADENVKNCIIFPEIN